MRRTAVLVFAFAAACVGTMEEKYPAGLSAGGADAGACDEPLQSGDDGHHNPGQPCLTCHRAGGTGTAFTVGGTLYTDLAGTAPLPDGTIHLIDAEGTELTLPVAANGNFWTSEPMAFPVHTFASLCPDTRAMITPVDTTGGDCNMGGCHVAGFRVALP